MDLQRVNSSTLSCREAGDGGWGMGDPGLSLARKALLAAVITSVTAYLGVSEAWLEKLL